MRLLLLAVVALVASTRGAPAGELRRTPPRDYQRLDDWAREHDFTVTRPSGSREILVTGGTTRIEMQLDSSRIEVNRVGVWLSHPVTATDQHVYLAAQDIRGVLEALFSPRKLPAGKRLRVICLDPGHGGKDPGQRSGNRFEKQYTLLLGEEVRERLVKAGFVVVLTRRDDSYPELPERTEIARRSGADLFLSLHFNAAPDGGSEASGIEVYAMTPEGSRSTNIGNDMGSLRAGAGNEFDPENLHLAFQIQKSILRNLPGMEDRGVRRARFVVLRLAEMPAVVIEGGFMSNPSDSRWIYSQTGRQRMAQAIVEGVSAYRRLVERPAPMASKTPEKGSKTGGASAMPRALSEVQRESGRARASSASGSAPASAPTERVPDTPVGTTPTNAVIITLPPQTPRTTNGIVFTLPPQRSTNSKSSSNTAAPESPKN